MTASVAHGRALRYAKGSARGLLHHHRGHCPIVLKHAEVIAARARPVLVPHAPRAPAPAIEGHIARHPCLRKIWRPARRRSSRPRLCCARSEAWRSARPLRVIPSLGTPQDRLSRQLMGARDWGGCLIRALIPDARLRFREPNGWPRGVRAHHLIEGPAPLTLPVVCKVHGSAGKSALRWASIMRRRRSGARTSTSAPHW